jgi:hypothetical protein
MVEFFVGHVVGCLVVGCLVVGCLQSDTSNAKKAFLKRLLPRFKVACLTPVACGGIFL